MKSGHNLDIKYMRLLPLDESKSKQYRIELDYLELPSLDDELNSFNDKKLIQKFIYPKNSKNRRYCLNRIS